MRSLMFMIFVGCTNSAEQATSGPHAAECVAINTSPPYVYRCENDETVCYIYAAGGLQCKWKGVTE